MNRREVFPDGETRAHERYLSSLSKIVTGGLLVDREQQALEPEQALLRVSGALLKAVTLAVYGNPTATDEQGPDGWCADSAELSPSEAFTAFTAIHSLLSGGGVVLAELRHRDEFRDSAERVEHLESAAAEAEVYAGRAAMAERERAANDTEGEAES